MSTSLPSEHTQQPDLSTLEIRRKKLLWNYRRAEQQIFWIIAAQAALGIALAPFHPLSIPILCVAACSCVLYFACHALCPSQLPTRLCAAVALQMLGVLFSSELSDISIRHLLYCLETVLSLSYLDWRPICVGVLVAIGSRIGLLHPFPYSGAPNFADVAYVIMAIAFGGLCALLAYNLSQRSVASALQLYKVEEEIKQMNAARLKLEEEAEQLSHSRERYEMAIASANGCAWEFDISTEKWFMSARLCEMLGYGEDYSERTPGQVLEYHTSPEALARGVAELHRYIRGEVSEYYFEFPVLHKSGAERWYVSRGSAVRSSEGKPTRVIGSVVDITRRHEAEAAQAESAMRYRLLFEHLPMPMFLYDSATLHFLDVNDAAIDHYGYSRDEFLSMRLTDLRTPEEAALLVQNYPELDTKSAAVTGMWRHLRKDGSPIWVEIISTIAGDKLGRNTRLIMARDVTEATHAHSAMQESERRFRHLFENATEGIFQSTISGRYLRVNPALAAMYGFDSPEHMMETLTDIAGSLYVKAQRRSEFVDAMLRQGYVENFDSEIHCHDGSTIWISENARCVRNPDGDVAYFEGFVKNITERKALETQREAMLAEALERADHDPLTGLLNHRAFHKRLEEEADRAQRSGSCLAVAVLDLDNFKFFNDAYGHAAGDSVLNMVASLLRTSCRTYDVLARFGGDEFAVLMPDVLPEAAASFPARIRETMEQTGFQPQGYDVKIPLGVTAGVSLFPVEVNNRHEIVELADQRLRRAKNGTNQESFGERLRSNYVLSRSGFKILDALVTAVDNKDRYTLKHSEDVMLYSVQIARALKRDEQFIEELQITALLHDLGKIGVPDHILRKPGKLTREEHEAIQQHAAMGAMIVSSVDGFACTLDGIRHHHERWDGQGYPDKIAGDAIPLPARILAVADAFSAMTTNRPYRTGMPHKKALKILSDGAGTQWDAACVEAFIKARTDTARV